MPGPSSPRQPCLQDCTDGEVSNTRPPPCCSVDCPIFRVPPQLLLKHEALILAALGGLQPTGEAAAMTAQLEGRLRRLSPDRRFNVLHLRAEDDWILHCARWENMRDGIVRDNCMNNTETVGDRLLLHRVDTEVPLLVATSWSQASDGLVQRAMQSLKKAGYQPVVRAELLEHGQELDDLGREESALVRAEMTGAGGKGSCCCCRRRCCCLSAVEL